MNLSGHESTHLKTWLSLIHDHIICNVLRNQKKLKLKFITIVYENNESTIITS